MVRISRTLKLGFGLIAILSFLALQAMGQTQQKPAPAPEKPKDTVTINGKVSAITDTSLTIVDDQKASHTIAIDANTKISKAGKEAKAADIKADDVVVVEARKGEGDAMTAVSITVGQAEHK